MVAAFAMTFQSVLWILAVLYLFLCCLYAYDRFWSSGQLQEVLFSLVLSLLLPVVGFIIVWMKDYYAQKSQERDYSEIFEGSTFFRDELKILKPIDKEKELNRVPMSEALSINSYELRRQMVMGTLTEDNTLEYIEVLKEALENEDSETSHYASSIIMQLQTKVQNSMISRAKEYERHPEDRELMKLYEKELYQLLASRIFEKDNLHRYFLEYEKLSDRFLEDEEPEEVYFYNRMQVNFMQGKFTGMDALVRRYLERFPRSEDAILCKIMLCIYTKDKKGLEEFLEELPLHPVILTQKTLEYIRFFRQEGEKQM